MRYFIVDVPSYKGMYTTVGVDATGTIISTAPILRFTFEQSWTIDQLITWAQEKGGKVFEQLDLFEMNS